MRRLSNIPSKGYGYPRVLRIALALMGLVIAFPLVAQDFTEYFVDKRGVALQGYDVVSYHEDGRAKLGSAKFQQRWSDVTWYFSSAEHLALFADDPEKYAPEYGGYCAYAVANNALAPIDPEAFSIVRDKLYLNYSHSVKRRWGRDQDNYIGKGNRNWPRIRRANLQ